MNIIRPFVCSFLIIIFIPPSFSSGLGEGWISSIFLLLSDESSEKVAIVDLILYDYIGRSMLLVRILICTTDVHETVR